MNMLAVLLALSAYAIEPGTSIVDEAAYEREVDLVGKMFLYPDRVTAGKLLQAAAEGASDQIHWLVVEADGADGVVLRHGNGAIIGAVTVASMATLPAALRSLEQVIVDSGYDTDDIDVRLEILKASTTALDRYSRVLAGEKLDRFDVRLKGTLVGVGATIVRRSGELVVTDVVPDGPGETGGLRLGDVIIRIDGVSTVNMEAKDAIDRVRGDVDTTVVLTVRRGKEDLIDLTLSRAEIVVPNVRSDVLTDGVGYLMIDHFSQRTVDNLTVEIAKLKAAGALSRGLVIDLRGNTGGSMKEAARTVDQFVTDGLLLRTEGPDGGEVQNLQARMDATKTGDEPEIPIAILIDHETASGAEILAGALYELDRAVLIGYPSYGKGTVQKIYNLDDDVRLKLTVAQYVLENDRKIAEGGLVPDTVLGRIDITPTGARYRAWEEPSAKVPWDQIVPVPHQAAGDGGRMKSAPQDFGLEVARRTVLRAFAPCATGAVRAETCSTREAALHALDDVLPEMRAEQEARLAEAYKTRGIDWTPEPSHSHLPPMQAASKVVIVPDPAHPDEVEVSVDVHNLDDQPLFQALVELECDTFDPWSGLVVPIGHVEPGAWGHGSVHLTLPPGVERREDTVRLRLRASGHPPSTLQDQLLQAASPPIARVSATAHLTGTGAERRAEITLENLGTTTLSDLRAQFAYPDGADVELIDSAVTADTLAARGKVMFTLGLRVGADAKGSVPLQLEVTARGGGVSLLAWPLALPLDGSDVHVEAPRVVIKNLPVSAPTGSLMLAVQIADDRLLDHVVVYANGNKVNWAGPGKSGKVDLRVPLELVAGMNKIVVLAEDDQGVVTRRAVVIRGEATGQADAGDP